MKRNTQSTSSELHIGLAILPIIVLIGFVILDYNWLNLADVRVGLILATIVTVGIGVAKKIKWSEFEESIGKNMKMMSFAFMFIMLIGLLIAAWSISGIIPSLVYYGISLISPELLLLTGFLAAGILATALGSSWTTMGTLGAAVMAIGTAIGYDATGLAMLAGAVISGSYLGDKISPLSDTTVLASNSSNVGLWDHFKGNLLYSGIAAGGAALLYLLLGFTLKSGSTSEIQLIKDYMNTNLTISWMLVLPFLLIIPIVYYKLPPIPALFGLAMVGLLLAATVQGMSWSDVLGIALWGPSDGQSLVAIVEADADKIGNIVNKIVNRGGIDGQSWTLTLVMLSAVMVGTFETVGIIDAIGLKIKQLATTARLRIASSTFASAFFSVIAGDQYIGLTVGPRIMGPEFDDMSIDRRNLSRSAEDGGTTAGVLAPWTGCAATASGALGVSTMAYLPFAFFPLLSVGLGIVLPLIGFGIIGSNNNSSKGKSAVKKSTKR